MIWEFLGPFIGGFLIFFWIGSMLGRMAAKEKNEITRLRLRRLMLKIIPPLLLVVMIGGYFVLSYVYAIPIDLGWVASFIGTIVGFPCGFWLFEKVRREWVL